ncbi:MAG: SIMPL domain-containing protein [Armatimonadetes bacterium]|nr:SIMPL domain-containing protein [Armatimonadota bacterium]
MKLLLIAAIAIAGWGTVMPKSANAQEDTAPSVFPNKATIAVTGTGEVSVTPDIARITVGVQTRGKDSAVAAAENATRTDAVIKAVRALGVAQKDIQTEGYSIYPQFDYQKQPPVLTDYQVSNSVRITVRKLADAGKILDAALKAGANVAGGIEFDLSDPQKARDEAMAKAVKDAVRKAKLMAKALDTTRTLTLLELSEGVASDYQQPRPMLGMAMAREAKAAPTPIEAGQTKITVSVTARFGFE